MGGSAAQQKQTVYVLGVIVVLLLAALAAWASFHPRALERVKTVTVTVTHASGTTTSLEVTTNARTLMDALAPYDLLTGGREGGTYMIWSVDGETVDHAAGEYWVCAANYEEVFTDTEARLISDGDVYDFFITVLTQEAES